MGKGSNETGNNKKENETKENKGVHRIMEHGPLWVARITIDEDGQRGVVWDFDG